MMLTEAYLGRMLRIRGVRWVEVVPRDPAAPNGLNVHFEHSITPSPLVGQERTLSPIPDRTKNKHAIEWHQSWLHIWSDSLL